MAQGAWKARENGWRVLDVPDGADIAGFTVEGLLGTGACGAVYRARRGEECFALKLLSLKELAGWAEREVTILLRLKHPNVVGFRACGTWPDRSPCFFYLAMELVEGTTVQPWARQENPSARRAALLLRGLARGLAAAHAADVLHRDVKESNVMVREQDGEPVLVDFGVGDYTGAPRLTQGVLPPGTPLYRSPEALAFQEAHWRNPQARYTATPADDLYALGVLFYLVLTGQYPAGPGTHLPPGPRELNPRVPRALSALCLRLLSPKPGERGSAQGLCTELEELLANAGAGWDVPLQASPGDRHAVPAAPPPDTESRPGQAPSPSAAPEAAGAGDARKPPGGSPPHRGRLARFAVLAGLGVCLALVVAHLRGGQPEPQPQPATAAGREMAPPASGPEPAGAAVPPQAVSTPAAAAQAAPQQEPDMPVKTTPPTADAPTPPSSGGWSPVGRALATFAACTGLACASGPQVRPPPPPEPCPPGAQEAMKALGINVDNEQSGSATFSPRGEGFQELTVREGPVTIRMGLGLGQLDNGTATGRLFLADRLYGYFDRATTKDGRTFPVCLVLIQPGVGRGVPLQPGDTAPGSARVMSTVELESVEHFR